MPAAPSSEQAAGPRNRRSPRQVPRIRLRPHAGLFNSLTRAIHGSVLAFFFFFLISPPLGRREKKKKKKTFRHLGAPYSFLKSPQCRNRGALNPNLFLFAKGREKRIDRCHESAGTRRGRSHHPGALRRANRARPRQSCGAQPRQSGPLLSAFRTGRGPGEVRKPHNDQGTGLSTLCWELSTAREYRGVGLGFISLHPRVLQITTVKKRRRAARA